MRCSATEYDGTVGEEAEEEQLWPPAPGAADIGAAPAKVAPATERTELPAAGLPTGLSAAAGDPARVPTACSAADQQRRGPPVHAEHYEPPAGVSAGVAARAGVFPALHAQHGLQPPGARVLPVQQLRARRDLRRGGGAGSPKGGRGHRTLTRPHTSRKSRKSPGSDTKE